MDVNAPTGFDPVPIPPGTRCQRHPHKEAAYRCSDCGAYTCSTCDFSIGNNEHVCPACVRARHVGTSTGGPPPVVSAPPPLSVTADTLVARPAVEGDLRCANHRNAAAVATCDGCGAYLCATCLFDVAGGLHYCPSCAVAPRSKLSSGRRWLMISGYALAALSTLIFGLTFAAAAGLIGSSVDEDAAGAVFVLVMFMSLGGTVVSFVAMDRNLGNPPALWGAAIWNLALLALLLVLSIIGNLSS